MEFVGESVIETKHACNVHHAFVFISGYLGRIRTWCLTCRVFYSFSIDTIPRCVCDAYAQGHTYVYTRAKGTHSSDRDSTRVAYVTVDCQPLFPGRSFSVLLSPSQTGHRCATRSLHIARCTRESAPASFRMIITTAIIGRLLSPRSTCQSAGEKKSSRFTSIGERLIKKQ